ncbi:unnamed protein product [Didymodactylos carnosus]|uniref:Uncharacterized protein n=1 Tax=Didymodactylos carnosus TaxID=1234261 RepID=A0A815NW40_9BILA|nr:unnamed protein product [Didymodactylos carnosus]CAF1519309.1 unnamed protein product [Didymodactylos carnosus]CAF4306273.1 unnamed protein product [Didymodactylos carnosus]CAF4318180.1 unnamed protein product [Didymodactylos carnosus]
MNKESDRGRQQHDQIGAKVSTFSTSDDANTSTTAVLSSSMVHDKQSEASSSPKPRLYGFTAKNARVFSDIDSLKMYQYKQMNTHFRRSSSPPSGLRNEPEEEMHDNIQKEEDDDNID